MRLALLAILFSTCSAMANSKAAEPPFTLQNLNVGGGHAVTQGAAGDPGKRPQTEEGAPAPSPTPTPEENQKKIADAFDAGDKDPEKLKAFLKDNPEFEKAFEESLKKDGDPQKLKDLVGGKLAGPLQVRYLAAKDPARLGELYANLEKAGKNLNNATDRAIFDEVRKLTVKHQGLVEAMSGKFGATQGQLAVMVEQWDRKMKAGDIKGLSADIANRYAAMHTDKDFHDKLTELTSAKGGNKLAAFMGVGFNEIHAKTAQERLNNSANYSEDQKQFLEAFQKDWPKQQDRQRDFNAQVGNIFNKYVKNGEVLPGGADAIKQLRDQYPNLSVEWAMSVGNKSAAFLAGYNATTGAWEFTPPRDLLAQGSAAQWKNMELSSFRAHSFQGFSNFYNVGQSVDPTKGPMYHQVSNELAKINAAEHARLSEQGTTEITQKPGAPINLDPLPAVKAPENAERITYTVPVQAPETHTDAHAGGGMPAGTVCASGRCGIPIGGSGAPTQSTCSTCPNYRPPPQPVPRPTQRRR